MQKHKVSNKTGAPKVGLLMQVKNVPQHNADPRPLTEHANRAKANIESIVFFRCPSRTDRLQSAAGSGYAGRVSHTCFPPRLHPEGPTASAVRNMQGEGG